MIVIHLSIGYVTRDLTNCSKYFHDYTNYTSSYVLVLYNPLLSCLIYTAIDPWFPTEREDSLRREFNKLQGEYKVIMN